MLQYGCAERWSARACQQKSAELNPDELDEAPVELSPEPEAYPGTDQERHNGYPTPGAQEYAMGKPIHHQQQQQQQSQPQSQHTPQQQHQQLRQQQRGSPEGHVSREQSADARSEGSYKHIAADAANQLHLLRQQHQLTAQHMRLEQQQIQQQIQCQQNWNAGGQ